MRDRLIELIKQAKKHTKDANTDIGRNMIFADHLIENGVIVPPCKVGDKVYCIYHNKVIQGTVSLIRPFISEKETIFKGNIICEVDNIFLDDGSKEVIELYVVFEKPYGIERIAYLTREEAEQALKGGGADADKT